MKSKVVYKCTVFDRDGKELFQREGSDEGVLADAACQRAHNEYPRDLLNTLQWQFEKIYPERLEHKPPPSGIMLKSWDNYVATTTRQLEARVADGQV